MENQNDVDYVDLLQIRGYMKNWKQNRPTEKSNKNYRLSDDKMASRKIFFLQYECVCFCKICISSYFAYMDDNSNKM
jgi:hypothetical protein